MRNKTDFYVAFTILQTDFNELMREVLTEVWGATGCDIFNAALKEGKALHIRCRLDQFTLFLFKDHSLNRTEEPFGHYQPKLIDPKDVIQYHDLR